MLNIGTIVALKKVIDSGCYVYGTYNCEEDYVIGRKGCNSNGKSFESMSIKEIKSLFCEDVNQHKSI